MVETDASVFFS